jgi:hypothetical protein
MGNVTFGYRYEKAKIRTEGINRIVKDKKASWSSTTGPECGTHRVSYGFLLFASLRETWRQRTGQRAKNIRRKQKMAPIW